MDSETRKQLCKISKFLFVKKALQTIIFNKLQFDGYVCCTNGLYPSNKLSLQKVLKQSQSRFYVLININTNNYDDLLKRMESIEFNYNDVLSFEESQSIVYAILQTCDATQKTNIVYFLLNEIFRKNRFHTEGDFIVEDSADLINIKSVDQFISKLEELPEKTTVLFRGHSNINYSIQPSLFRMPKFYKNEYRMYQEMVIRCSEYFSSCHSHLDFLVEMQHYGLPTRLLDFTFNPLIALYFACENQLNTGEVIIYTVNNQELYYDKDEKVSILSCLSMLPYNKQTEILSSLSDKIGNSSAQDELIDEIRIERPSFARKLSIVDLRSPIFVKPTRNNKRIAHQEGAFLLWGLDTVHYSNQNIENFIGDQEKYRFELNERKQIFFIEQSNKEKIIKTLNRIGINKAFVYPEIDDVADYIKSTIE